VEEILELSPSLPSVPSSRAFGTAFHPVRWGQWFNQTFTILKDSNKQNKRKYIPSKVQQVYNQHSRYHMGSSIHALTICNSDIHIKLPFRKQWKRCMQLGRNYSQVHTQNNLRGSIMPSRYNVAAILVMVCCASKVNQLDGTWFRQFPWEWSILDWKFVVKITNQAGTIFKRNNNEVEIKLVCLMRLSRDSTK
jgi:hypothetical protein